MNAYYEKGPLNSIQMVQQLVTTITTRDLHMLVNKKAEKFKENSNFNTQ